MYYVLDFADHSEGLYTLHRRGGIFDPKTASLLSTIAVTTNPDLESYAAIVEDRFTSDYTPITLDQVQSNKIYTNTIRLTKHMILIGGMWEIHALLRAVHPGCFEFSFGSGERIFVNEFALGEPDL